MFGVRTLESVDVRLLISLTLIGKAETLMFICCLKAHVCIERINEEVKNFRSLFSLRLGESSTDCG